ncbi:MAG: type II secretion system F family protein [Dehalococcoidia bacterium]|nr:type II secretion system F family protein [Dehalococcoidia bacterium]
MLALIAAVAAFVSASSLLAWFGGAMRNPVEARISRLAPVGSSSAMKAPFSDRVFMPVLDGLTSGLIQLLPHRFVSRVSRQLLAAGSPMTTQAFFTLALLCGLAFPAAGLFFLARSSDGVAGWMIVVAAFLAFAGFIVPYTWLRRRVRLRKLTIWRRLADVFDMVTVCVEAGLGLDAAMRQVAAKLKGPFSDEISLMLRQVGMGRPRREALEDLAYRVDVPEVTTFVHAIVQAEQLGTSLGRVLRAQSLSLRVRRRQKAEEMARRAPVKMVFPLVLFIMPTFFIVTIGPMFVHLTEYLKD